MGSKLFKEAQVRLTEANGTNEDLDKKTRKDLLNATQILAKKMLSMALSGKISIDNIKDAKDIVAMYSIIKASGNEGDEEATPTLSSKAKTLWENELQANLDDINDEDAVEDIKDWDADKVKAFMNKSAEAKNNENYSELKDKG